MSLTVPPSKQTLSSSGACWAPCQKKWHSRPFKNLAQQSCRAQDHHSNRVFEQKREPVLFRAQACGLHREREFCQS